MLTDGGATTKIGDAGYSDGSAIDPIVQRVLVRFDDGASSFLPRDLARAIVCGALTNSGRVSPTGRVSPNSGRVCRAATEILETASWAGKETYDCDVAADPLERVRDICLSVGFELYDAETSLLDRLRLLAEHSETIDDAVRISARANAIFRYYAEHRPSEAFSETERRTVILGGLFSDVGKTGPRDASVEDRRLIVEMFAVESVPDDTMTVARFIQTYFSDSAARVGRFAALGLDPAMSIREFWNLHTGWTLAILEHSGVPVEAVAAAATHHFIDNVNPEAIVGEGGLFTRDFGDNAGFDRAEKLVIVLDKYDAVRRRGRRTHAEAIAWLRDRITRTPRAREDVELEALMSVVDDVLARQG